MPDFTSMPGGDGVVAIIVATLATSVGITLVTGSLIHWPFIIAGIIVGSMAARMVR